MMYVGKHRVRPNLAIHFDLVGMQPFCGLAPYAYIVDWINKELIVQRNFVVTTL